MSDKIFMKGTEAVAEAAIRAGCRFFAGYPITPQNEMPEYMSRKQPLVGGVFIQGESEVASVNMVFGAAAAGVRCMTSSSSTGIALKSEGIAFLAGARLPSVIANFQRGGPGIGDIKPAQQDYFEATKASGNGGFQMLVFAPASVQEAVDMTYEAFEKADKYLRPTYLLLDGVIGTMMEPVVLPEAKSDEEIARLREEKKAYAAIGRNGGEPHSVMCGPGLSNKLSQEAMNKEDAALYEVWARDEVAYEFDVPEDSELVLTGYGTSGRIAKSAVKLLRREGYKVGFIRPLMVNPFPAEAFERLDYSRLKGILVAEMSIPAQYGADVKLAVHGRTEIATALSSGGQILDRGYVLEQARKMYGDK